MKVERRAVRRFGSSIAGAGPEKQMVESQCLLLRRRFPRDGGTRLSPRSAFRGELLGDDDNQTWQGCCYERQPLISLDDHWMDQNGHYGRLREQLLRLGELARPLQKPP